MRLRTRLSNFWVSGNIAKPTREELEEAHAHADHENAALLEAGAGGHPADGHDFDGRDEVASNDLR
jgi:ubiquinol-cytochrome c reductase cytochrome b subunit